LSSCALTMSMASIGFAVDSGADGSSDITIGGVMRRDERFEGSAHWWDITACSFQLALRVFQTRRSHGNLSSGALSTFRFDLIELRA